MNLKVLLGGLLVLCVVVSSCELPPVIQNAAAPPTATSDVQPTQQSARNPSAEVLASLVKKLGEPCGTVTEKMFTGLDDAGAEYWSVRCTKGGPYMVTLKRSGDVSVASCAVLAAVNVPCFKTFAEQKRESKKR